jgi:hypothetical protein
VKEFRRRNHKNDHRNKYRKSPNVASDFAKSSGHSFQRPSRQRHSADWHTKSCYRFVITCEKKMHGRLSGNPHNGLSCEAVLMGALVIHGEHLHTLISRLEPQSQALFFVQQGDKLLNLLTSVITTLSCLRPVEE